jgi:Protein of unknown function (DUF3124)
MGIRSFAKASLLLLLLGLYIWIAASENPIRNAREQARSAHHQSLSARFRRVTVQPHPTDLFASSIAELPTETAGASQGTVYVPAYSRIRSLNELPRIDLATTLSIHNTSRDTAIVLERVDYHNTEGTLVQAYLERPIALKPFGTIEVFVPRDDFRGGAGANFVIDWTSAEPVPAPAIEAVMIGAVGTVGYSFVSQGRNVRSVATN